MTNLHYGCGTVVGPRWLNCDASPTLRLQRLSVIGFLFRMLLKPRFPDAIVYGEIVSGLTLEPQSCDNIFCSHVLEHLALDDFRAAIRNTHKYLKPGGTFRLVVPDFEALIAAYQSDPQPDALSRFLAYSFLGRKKRPGTIADVVRDSFGHAHHLWMWDFKGMAMELETAGFRGIRRYQYEEAAADIFHEVERQDRFLDALAIECTKA